MPRETAQRIKGWCRTLYVDSTFAMVLFFVTSMLIVFVLGKQPIFLLKISSILEGVLLIALQAVCVGVGLYFVMPKMLSKEAYAVLKPGPIFAVGLLATFAFFGYLCVTQIPRALLEILRAGQ